MIYDVQNPENWPDPKGEVPEPPIRPTCGSCPFFDIGGECDDYDPDSWKRGERHPCRYWPTSDTVFKSEDDFCAYHPDMDEYLFARKAHMIQLEMYNDN